MIILLLIIIGIYGYVKYRKFTIELIESEKNKNQNSDEALYETIRTFGYSYNEIQDIFYSNIDAWQRGMGYCRLYDEAAAPLGMIIDCEPIYFEYEGRRWMI